MGKEKKISTAKTDAEYRARAKKWYYSHGNSMTGFEATEGIYYKADGTKVKIRTALAFDKKTNTRKPESQRSFTLADAENQASVTTRRKAKEKVPDRLRSKFPSDESFEGFKQYIKQGFASNQAKRKALNAYYKENNIIDPNTGKIKKVDLGHVSSFGDEARAKNNPELVGSNDPMSQKMEIASGSSGNRRLQHKGDKPVSAIQKAGWAVNWDDSADNYLSSEHRAKYEILTPQDQQRIVNGESPDEVFAQRRAAIKANPDASGTSHNRKRMAGYTNPAKALRIARMGTLGPLSLGLGATTMGLSAKAAWKDPTANNIEDAAWDTVNFTADALSLIPILAVPMEGAQKLLGWGHLSRMATRNLNAGQQAEIGEEESRRKLYEAGGGNAAMTKYGWTIEQTMLRGRKNLGLQHLENMKEYK